MHIRLFKLDNVQIENCNNHSFFLIGNVAQLVSEIIRTQVQPHENKYWTVGLKGQHTTEKQLAAIGSFQPNSPHAHMHIAMPTLIECMYQMFVHMYVCTQSTNRTICTRHKVINKFTKNSTPKSWGCTIKRSWSSK